MTSGSDHRSVEQTLAAAGWTRCGAGDWAVALRSPDGSRAARISPFDPTGPYTAELYRAAAHTRQVPRLFEHRRLTGGGDLQVLEWLEAVPEAEAAAFHRALAARAEEVAELADIVRRVHERAIRELPWCGPLDTNPANVMRGSGGRLVVADLFYADGPALYATAARDPALVAARIPESERRFMTEIPLAASGPWPPAEREAMRAGLAAADARPFYTRHAGFYDRLITDPVEPWVEAVDRELGGPSLVLDAGCGTGRHAAGLIAAGHRVDLVDASAELLAIAADRCPQARARQADLCRMAVEPGYDAVTCRGVLNDLIEDDDRQAAVRSLAGSLRPGGALFLDVREREGSRRRADGAPRVRRAGALTFTSRTTWDDGLLRVDETYEVDGRTSRYGFTMRPWTEAELRARLGECGLHRVRVEPGVGRPTPDRLFVVAG